ncbi:Pfs [Aspergillus affinis]|uniref:Pfs n=1 Tax=Aspergillus affinis TaxID=1070780 RepID=UPI0022FE31AE|nr:Pfs [Aspergillus affinis]KAI9044119.1 Pfs [Aspergillus affinis]
MEHLTRRSAIPEYVEEMLERYPVMRKKGFGYPDGAEDVLFDSGYEHVGKTRACARCVEAGRWEGRVVAWPLREDRSPILHYGMIVSGSAVVKHSPTRLVVEQEHRATCIEMEAAGIMNYFPCLVIRIIGGYAAATAAVCAKEPLEYVPVKATILDSNMRQRPGECAPSSREMT